MITLDVEVVSLAGFSFPGVVDWRWRPCASWKAELMAPP
jgi:hypothetical protein